MSCTSRPFEAQTVKPCVFSVFRTWGYQLTSEVEHVRQRTALELLFLLRRLLRLDDRRPFARDDICHRHVAHMVMYYAVPEAMVSRLA